MDNPPIVDVHSTYKKSIRGDFSARFEKANFSHPPDLKRQENSAMFERYPMVAGTLCIAMIEISQFILYILYIYMMVYIILWSCTPEVLKHI